MARKKRITIDWSKWDDQLGKEADKELAEKIGCSIPAVSNRRNKLGVAASQDRKSRLDWEKFDALLGTVEDKTLAMQIGCSSAAVVQRRRKLNVDAFRQRKSVDWTDWDAKIEGMSDTQLAKIIGCAPGSVKARREKLGLEKFDGDLRKKVDWKQWEKKIGVVPDKDLALMIGCTVGAINAHRKKLGIGVLSAREIAIRTDDGDIWSRWQHLLGKCPDDVLAELMGITRSKVGVRRMRLIIANYGLDWPEGAKPCLGGCGKALTNDEDTCGKEVCHAKFVGLR